MRATPGRTVNKRTLDLFRALAEGATDAPAGPDLEQLLALGWVRVVDSGVELTPYGRRAWGRSCFPPAMSVTDAEAEAVVDVLKRATGWPKSYRNHFVAGEGHRDWPTLMLATESMLMQRTQPWRPRTRPRPYVFSVTAAGMLFLDRWA